jgi:hypothetical protein
MPNTTPASKACEHLISWLRPELSALAPDSAFPERLRIALLEDSTVERLLVALEDEGPEAYAKCLIALTKRIECNVILP